MGQNLMVFGSLRLDDLVKDLNDGRGIGSKAFGGNSSHWRGGEINREGERRHPRIDE